MEARYGVLRPAGYGSRAQLREVMGALVTLAFAGNEQEAGESLRRALAQTK